MLTFRSKQAILTFALVALLAKAPQELLAEGAKGGLAEELGHKLVAVDFVRPAGEIADSRVGLVLGRRNGVWYSEFFLDLAGYETMEKYKLNKIWLPRTYL